MLPILGNGMKVEVVSTCPKTIEVGDIIFFEEKKHTKAHRVVDFKEHRGKLFFLTKGDSSFVIDNPVCEDKVIGKVVNSKGGSQPKLRLEDLIRQTTEANGVNFDLRSENLVVLYRTVNFNLFKDTSKISVDELTKMVSIVKELNPHVTSRLEKNGIYLGLEIRFSESVEKLFQFRLDLRKKIIQINQAATDFVRLVMKL